MPTLENFLASIGGSKYMNIVTQYTTTTSGAAGNPTTLWGGSWMDFDHPVPSSYPTSAQFQAEVLAAATHFNAPDDGVIVVALPPKIPMPSGYCARHGSFVRSGHKAIPYVELPYQANGITNCDPCPDAAAAVTDSMFHELMEAVTDPRYDQPNGKAYVDNSDGEI